MCLDRWPKLTKCCVFLSLKAGVVLYSMVELIVSTALFAYTEFLVDVVNSGVDFVSFLKATMIIRIISTFFLISSWAGLVMKWHWDMFLKLYIYLTITSTFLYFILSLTFLICCWNTCIVKASVQLGVSLVAYPAIAYMLVVVNSFRMYIT